MTDIPLFIKMLQSNNPNKRYDACEKLRVSSFLPPEAIKALRTVTNDVNPDVADAAQRALALHISDSTQEIVDGDSQNTSSVLTQDKKIRKQPILIWGCSALTLIAIFAVIGVFFETAKLSIDSWLNSGSRASLNGKGSILFNRSDELHIMNADGSNVTSLGVKPGDHGFSISPDGTKIAFSDYSTVSVMNLDGSGRVDLVDCADDADICHLSHPIWSPDGSKIAYGGREEYRYDEKAGFGVSESDGTSIIEFPLDIIDAHREYYNDLDICFSPSWSPDGSRIVFNCYKAAFDKYYPALIFTAEYDGTNFEKLSVSKSDDETFYSDFFPYWLPDGNIAFWSLRNGETGLYTMNPDGTNRFRLLHPNMDISFNRPIWSPDGTKILMTSGEGTKEEIYVVDLKTSYFARLTSNTFVDRDPAWSPDSSMIVFSSDRDGNKEIYAMNVDGSNVIRLTYNIEADEYPHWSNPSLKLSSTPSVGIGSTLVRPTDRMTMVYVPTGKFQMGISQEDANWLVEQDWCSWNEDHCEISWFNSEQPIHTVDLDAFWIDKYEVTNGQYASCVAEGACSPPKDIKSYDHEVYYGNSEYNEYPVLYMDWTQANSYCTWAAGRLPTEAEWEKAARGTDDRIFPWGNKQPDCKLAAFDIACGSDFSRVGSYPLGASPYGAMDMAGNVWEWVSDWYQYDYYEISPLHNPQGPSSGENRIMRGGTIVANEYTSRTTMRSSHDPNDGWIINGFRCVMDAE